MERAIKQYLARIGAMGGKATGKRKRRGGKAFYSRLAKEGLGRNRKGIKKKGGRQNESGRLHASFHRRADQEPVA